MRYAVAFLVPLIASPAAAAVIAGGEIVAPHSGYASNDPPSSGAAQQVADDFAVRTTAARLDSLVWWGNYSQDEDEAGTETEFTIRFFRDADDYGPTSPNSESPVLFLAVTATASITGIATTGDSRDVFRYSADFVPPLELSRGAYWLSIVESDPETSEIWEWQNTTAAQQGARNHVIDPLGANTWSPVVNGRHSRAFILTGEFIGTVPEPASGLLLAIGMVAIGHRHHRRNVK